MRRSRTKPSSVTGSRGNRWFHAAKVGGGSVFGAAGVLAAIGALADVGAATPHQIWLSASLGSFALAVVLLIVGSIGEELTRSVTDAHAATLHATTRLLIESLELGNPCSYPADGHRPKDALHAHYPDVGRSLTRWDALLRSTRASQQEARDAVVDILAEHGVAAPQYEVSSIARVLDNIMNQRLRADGVAQAISINRSGYLSSMSGTGIVTAGSETWMTLPALSADETAEAWTERAKAAMARVDAAVDAVQKRPLHQALADIRSVRDFKTDEMPTLIDDLRRISELEHPSRKRACPTC